MSSMNIKGVEVKIGDKITVYTKRGANVVGTIEQIDPTDNTAYVGVMRSSGTAPHSADGWYTIKVSGRGIPYAAQ